VPEGRPQFPAPTSKELVTMAAAKKTAKKSPKAAAGKKTAKKAK
jgi:hypothetical protein